MQIIFPRHAIFWWTFLVVVLHEVRHSTSKSVSPLDNPPENEEDFIVDEHISLIRTDVDDFICPWSDGKFRHEIYCEQYYFCKDFVPTGVYRCPTEYNFLFSDDKFDCDYAYEVHCGNRTRPDDVSPTYKPPSTEKPEDTTTPIPTTSTMPDSTTTEDPIDTYNCTENGAFPHSLHCDLYFDCWAGVDTLLKCPRDYLFDTVYKGCSPPSFVDCGERVPSGEFRCPPNSPDWKLYPDPVDCASFYSCKNPSIPLKQTCPDILVFNKYLEVCDHQSNVDCTDRHISILRLRKTATEN